MRLVLVVAVFLAAVSAWALPTAVGETAPGSGTFEWTPVREYAVKWVQLPLVGGNAWASQYDYVYPFYSESSDDFMCTDPRPIEAIEWWGTYWNPGADPFAEYFVIRFYDNVVGPPSTPGTLLYEEYCTVYTEEYDAAVGQYHYFQEMTVPFNQVPGTIYWVSIQAVLLFPPQWGWCQSGSQWNDFAVQDFELAGVPRWTTLDTDMAFALYVNVLSPVEETTWGGIKAMYR